MVVDMSCQRVTLRICLVLLLSTINDVINLESPIPCPDENGGDATAIHRLTSDEKLALERDMLKVLGLPVKPNGTNGKALLIKGSAVKFSLNVGNYKANKHSEMKPNESAELSEFGVTGEDLRTIDESDVMITFMAQQSHQGAGSKPARIWFDVGAVSAEYQMTSAELRLYRGPHAQNRKNRGSFIITAYRVLRKKKGSEREMLLVDSAHTIAGHEGWITLNVTESLHYWLKHPDDNKGLYISVRPINSSSCKTRPENIGIVGLEGDAERQPFMIGFFGRNASDNARHIQPKLQSFGNFHKRNKKRDTCIQTSDSPCKVEHLYVDFKDLQWEDKIIAPEGFYANRCSGDCKFPLHSQKNLTYHAIILARANLLHPNKIPAPSCAPTKLTSIDVIYYAENDRSIIKEKWENMMVQECGCL